MKLIFGVCLIFIFHSNLFSQNNISKKIFYKTIKKENKDENLFFTCNQDSTFYKADTIKLYKRNSLYSNNSICCEILTLNFMKKNLCLMQEEQFCKEPSTAKIFTNKDFYKVKIQKDKNYLLLDFLNAFGLSEKFKILSIKHLEKQNEYSDIITMERIQ